MHSMVRGLGGAIDGVATGKPDINPTYRFAFAQTLNGFLHALNSFSEYFTVDQTQLVRMPSHMTFEQASTLPIAAATAQNSLYGHHPVLQAGDTVLCMGTGGVSLFAAQVNRSSGFIAIRQQRR
jgi:NADPH:quinone reductase-like Zn-dependent oxidoreductase